MMGEEAIPEAEVIATPEDALVVVPEVVEPESEPLPDIEMIPRDLTANTKRRFKLIYHAEKSAELRAAQKAMCANDIIYWVNLYAATYDPRKNPSTIPFLTYPYEDQLLLDLVDCIANQKDLLIEKSRDMGVSWCVLLAFTWFWQFKGEGYDFLVGSRKEQYIDQIGNMSTLLEKVRFLIRNQPKWLRPKGFDFKSHSNYLKIVNPETKAIITGEATNNNFSRSGRFRAIMLDEFAFWECDKQAWRASADSSNCRIVVSTPCGYNNKFSELRHSGAIKITTLHWKLHPEKDQAWYDNECQRRNHDSVEIAQELDINYEGSEEGVLFEFAEMQRAVSNAPPMSPDRLVVSLDPAGEGEDEAVFYVGNNGNIVERKFIAKSTDPQLAAEAVMLITKYKAQVFISDSIGNSVADLVSQLLGRNERGVKVIKFKSSEKATDPTYFNRRDQVYHQAAIQMKSGNVQIDDDYTLMKQLNATKYKKDNGRIYINSKEEIKEVIGKSPDRADSWVLNVEGLRFTHSVHEVKQAEGYRNVIQYDEVRAGQEYGDWGDQLE
jgi:hypothetical protein